MNYFIIKYKSEQAVHGRTLQPPQPICFWFPSLPNIQPLTHTDYETF